MILDPGGWDEAGKVAMRVWKTFSSGVSCVAIPPICARCICPGAYCARSIRQFNSTKTTKTGRHLTALLPTHPQHLLQDRTTVFPARFSGALHGRPLHTQVSRAAANPLARFSFEMESRPSAKSFIRCQTLGRPTPRTSS